MTHWTSGYNPLPVMPAVLSGFQGFLLGEEKTLVLPESPADVCVSILESLTRPDLSWEWAVFGIHPNFQSSAKGPS